MIEGDESLISSSSMLAKKTKTWPLITLIKRIFT